MFRGWSQEGQLPCILGFRETEGSAQQWVGGGVGSQGGIQYEDLRTATYLLSSLWGRCGGKTRPAGAGGQQHELCQLEVWKACGGQEDGLSLDMASKWSNGLHPRNSAETQRSGPEASWCHGSSGTKKTHLPPWFLWAGGCHPRTQAGTGAWGDLTSPRDMCSHSWGLQM